MKKNISDSLLSVICAAIKDSGADDSLKDELYLEVPPAGRFGDLSSNVALRLASAMRKPPVEIAGQLAEKIKLILKDDPVARFVSEVKAEGAGFINFYLSREYFLLELAGILKTPAAALAPQAKQRLKVLIEFVSANPTGSLSVAHARQAVVGDVLANIFNFCRHKVKREYYLNDEGNQIEILGNSVGLRIRELSGEKIEFPENYYQGEYIYDIAKEARRLNVNSEKLGEFACEYILNQIKNELADFGVKFDYWTSQKALRKSGRIGKALDFLKKRELLYEQEGALWFKSTQFGDDKDRVVIKSDSSYTYLAPDIAYHREKYRRGFTLLINLWGPDHHGYINRLKAAVEALGQAKESLSIIIVQLATIFREGKPVQMSTRRGQYITLREVLDEVGSDASRFFFLMRRTSSHLDFDLDIAKKHTSENPVYYVQYAHARICSILRNSPGRAAGSRQALELLKEEEELRLIKKIIQFPYIIDVCVKTQDPYMLTVYLQELAESFHKFYDRHRVLGEDQELSRARLALIQAAKLVLAQGLKLLGISRPEEM